MLPPVLILAGPTGVGKSAVAMELAKAWDAEIVSADARQVYRGLDIGTAKPTPEERQQVPHHLLDLIEPSERFSAARFMVECRGALARIMERGKRAIVVGGTGLYLRALREGLFEAPEATPEVRLHVDELASFGGPSALADYLARHDPATLASLDRANTARLRRAVEFHLSTKESLVEVRRNAQAVASPFRYYPVVLVRPRPELYDRISVRVSRMIESGWLEEVSKLAGQWDFSLPAFDAVGYRDLYAVVQERVTLAEAAGNVITRTRQYAKRQVTWFSHQGHWIWMTPDNEVTLKITSGLSAFAENKSA